MSIEDDVKTIERLAPRYTTVLAFDYFISPGKVTVSFLFKNGDQAQKTFASFSEAITGIASMFTILENARGRS